MTTPPSISITDLDLDAIAAATGRVALFINAEGKLDLAARRVNKLCKGGVQRVISSEAFEKLASGGIISLAFPVQMEAKAIDIVKLERRPTVTAARKAGSALALKRGEDDVLLLAGASPKAAEIALGFALRAYDFTDHKTAEDPEAGQVTLAVTKPDEVSVAMADGAAIVEGVFFTRDLINEPSNVLTTTDFASRLVAMKDLGLEVEVLDEPELEELGMGALLGVGQGSDSPSKVVVMKWNGGGDEAPFALIGKGVVFDTGGISLKPAGGMEDMTMDMGGAGTVAGVMRTLALRKAKANVIGLVGLVENMPDGRAQRPGDVVKSMKGDTIEVINTDAEGRLVLADVLWYAQETYKPSGIIDLATLTGAIIIGLGHENAGVFSNDDSLANAFLKAAETEEEGAWRMPMGKAYDEKLKSRIADMKNVGGRDAGSITAAQFLKRFVKDETPWIHLDIAGVASVKTPTTFAPKGATGWGVRALDRLIRDKFEG